MSVHPALIDRFGREHTYLRMSLTDRCNLRCTYCMPQQGIQWAESEQMLRTDEIIRLAKIFTGLGVTKIRLTGGEPLLHRDIIDLTSTLSRLPGLQTLALTTNGVKLPPLAKKLYAAGLTSVTISLDSLKAEKFAAIARRDRLPDVLAGIDAAIEAGFSPVKINMVVMANVNDDEILDFIDWASGRVIDLRFIEYMPFPDTRWKKAGLVPYKNMLEIISQKYSVEKIDQQQADVGKTYALKGHTASVSFISSMTESFCASCNRLRITADGNLKACLFHPDEKSLRDIMRDGGSDADLVKRIALSLQGKPESHAPMEELLALGNRTMISIGG